MERRKENQLQIEVKDDVASGTYSNLTVVAHSASEFVMDFICIMPNLPKGQVKSRIIMAPEHTKRLMLALQDNIIRYEQQFGEIRLPERDGYMPGASFKCEA